MLQLILPLSNFVANENNEINFISPSLSYITKISMDSTKLLSLKETVETSFKHCAEDTCYDQIEKSIATYYDKNGVHTVSLVLGITTYAVLFYKNLKLNKEKKCNDKLKKCKESVAVTLRFFKGAIDILDRSHSLKFINESSLSSNILPLMSPYCGLEFNILRIVEIIALRSFLKTTISKLQELISELKSKENDTSHKEILNQLTIRLDILSRHYRI